MQVDVFHLFKKRVFREKLPDFPFCFRSDSFSEKKYEIFFEGSKVITKDGTVERSLSYYYEQVYGSGTFEEGMDALKEEGGDTDAGDSADDKQEPSEGKNGE